MSFEEALERKETYKQYHQRDAEEIKEESED